MRAVILDRPLQGAHAERDQQRQREHDRRVTEGEPEPDAQRALAFLHQLAGRVVDRRDVIGIERMPQPERVGRHPDPDRERARPAEAVPVRCDQRDQCHEAEHVQAGDGQRHHRQGPALASAQ
jgi:hypothetical protein